MQELSEKSLGNLFTTILQHMKCIELRIECAKATTTQKQKYVLSNIQNKIQVAINHLCDLLPDSKMVLDVKKELDKSDLVYVMLITEQLMQLGEDDLEEVVELVQNYINNKYKNNDVVSTE